MDTAFTPLAQIEQDTYNSAKQVLTHNAKACSKALVQFLTKRYRDQELFVFGSSLNDLRLHASYCKWVWYAPVVPLDETAPKNTTALTRDQKSFINLNSRTAFDHLYSRNLVERLPPAYVQAHFTTAHRLLKESGEYLMVCQRNPDRENLYRVLRLAQHVGFDCFQLRAFSRKFVEMEPSREISFARRFVDRFEGTVGLGNKVLLLRKMIEGK